MTAKNEFLLNSLLLLLIAGLVVFLVYDVRKVRYDLEEDQRQMVRFLDDLRNPNETDFGGTLFAQSLFEQNDRFRPIVTPIPTNTAVPVPTPTPAPPPFAEYWQIRMILGPVVQVVDYLGNSHYLREGQVLEGVKIIEVNQQGEYIQVENLEDGRQKRLRKTNP